MTFTQMVDTKFNVKMALTDVEMVKHWAECVREYPAGKSNIDKVIEYCDYTIKHLEEARDCLQAEVDKVLEVK